MLNYLLIPIMLAMLALGAAISPSYAYDEHYGWHEHMHGMGHPHDNHGRFLWGGQWYEPYGSSDRCIIVGNPYVIIPCPYITE